MALLIGRQGFPVHSIVCACRQSGKLLLPVIDCWIWLLLFSFDTDSHLSFCGIFCMIGSLHGNIYNARPTGERYGKAIASL